MQFKLRSIAAALVPTLGLSLGAATGASAAMRGDAEALVGVQVSDGSGRRFGTIQNVMLDDDGRMATLLVKKRNQETEALRVDIDAALSSRRGNDLILLVQSEPVTRYGYNEPRERERIVTANPMRDWDPRIKMSSDSRLNRLIGVPVVDWNGRTLGQVENVATANHGQGEKAYAIVDPTVGSTPLVVPLGDYGRVLARVDGPSHIQPDEIVVSRENGIGYIALPPRY